jgi:hypothetical protein
VIDTSFDFRTDAGGKDVDSYSPTLRRYHQALWSKPLPSGAPFDLDDTTPNSYLHHRSNLGEFFLASDTVITTLTGHGALAPIRHLIPESETITFLSHCFTIGGMLVFPGNRVNGKMTINGARGFHPRITDRLDLTLECIRRHYLGQPSPLGGVLDRYRDFFALFEDFHGYVDFFLLQDLVTNDYSRVAFFAPFDDFMTPAIPKDINTYREYTRLSIEFVQARSRRIGALNLA